MIDEVLAKLERVKATGRDQWSAICPAHADGSPSLSVSLKSGRVLVNCFAGCEAEDIIAAVGLTWADMFEDGPLTKNREAKETKPPEKWPVRATYTYRADDGTEIYQVRRMVSEDSGRKTFRQYRRVGSDWIAGMDGVERVLYNLPAICDAHDGQRIFVVEGEQCADDLARLGVLVTTNVGGAGKWSDEYSKRLVGLEVVILPDNDEPGERHASDVARSLAKHALRVKVLRLPDLPKKGDVTDWLRAGGTLRDLEELCAEPVKPALNAFAPASERIKGEALQRKANQRRILKFGIPFLDDAMGGIFPHDLVLVGAPSGAGKTQLASLVTRATLDAGKRVHYFALEADDDEIEMRIKYQMLARAHYANGHGRPIRYADWRRGALDDVLDRHEEAVMAEYNATVKNLATFYRRGMFTATDFVHFADAIKADTDLIVLDHLHYIDSRDPNENRGYKDTVKAIRDAAIVMGKPVLAVAHLRKRDSRLHRLIPSLDDFHGSSDIAKIATKAIMIAPDYTRKFSEATLWPTFMQIVKCRMDGSLVRYAARLVYDAAHDQYGAPYEVGRLKEAETVFEEIPLAEYPAWARATKRLGVVEDPRTPDGDTED